MSDNLDSLKLICDTLLCPVTGKPLTIQDGQLTSTGNNKTFPLSLGVPWLYRNSAEQLLQWRHKIKSVADYYHNQSDRAAAELQKVDLMKSTRKRLEILQDTHKKNAEIFLSYLATLAATHEEALHELEKVFFEKVPRQQTVKAYHDTIFRDWVWGENELDKQLEALSPFLKDVERLLVLGAGACGLPLKIHQKFHVQQTLAVDINPIFLLAIKQLLSGAQVTMIENPLIPVHLQDIAVEHKIKSKFIPKGFHLLLADAQSLPTQKEAFSTVLTPWFIDIVPRNFRELSRHINQCLKKGGRWINIGQLDFHRYQLSEVYTQEEITEALSEAGFQIEDMKNVALPYLQSAQNMVGRQDNILIFSAVKEKTCKEPPRFEYLPDWLTDWNQPIPLKPEITQFMVKSTVFSRTVSLVDGKNNLNDIASTLAKQFNMPLPAAREAVYNFFVNVFEQVIFREF